MVVQGGASLWFSALAPPPNEITQQLSRSTYTPYSLQQRVRTNLLPSDAVSRVFVALNRLTSYNMADSPDDILQDTVAAMLRLRLHNPEAPATVILDNETVRKLRSNEHNVQGTVETPRFLPGIQLEPLMTAAQPRMVTLRSICLNPYLRKTV
jgi:hypothetical protein